MLEVIPKFIVRIVSKKPYGVTSFRNSRNAFFLTFQVKSANGVDVLIKRPSVKPLCLCKGCHTGKVIDRRVFTNK